MKGILKKIGLFSLGILAAIGFTACKSKSDTKPTDTKPTETNTSEDKKESFTVSGQTMEGVTVKVYTVVNAERTEITDFTQAIAKGTKLYFQITNSSDKIVKLALKLGGTDYKSVVVNAGETGEITGAELTNNIVYSVTETTAVETASLTVTVDHSHDTTTEINSVHVYDPTDPDRTEKASGSDIEIGSELKVFVWNVATNVHLKITNGTETVADKDYPKLREDQIGPGNYGHNEYFTFTVTGDVKVEVTYVEEITTKYTVTVDNSFTDLTVNLSYVISDSEGIKVYPIVSGNEVPANVPLSVQLINDSSTTAYVAYAEINNNVVNGGMVEVGPDMFGGISAPTIVNGNVTIKTEELSAISVTFTKMTGVNVLIQDLSGFEPVILDSGDTTFKYCPVSVEIENTLTVPVILTLTYMEQTIGMTIPAGEKFSEELIAEGSASFVIEEYVEYDCEIDLGGYDLEPYIMYMTQESSQPIMLENGDKVAKSTPVMIMIENKEETKILMLTIKNGDTTVYNGVLPQFYMLEDEYITITGKLVVKVFEAVMPDDNVDVYLDNDIADATVKLEFENEDGETVTVNTFSATIPADVEVTITITNNSAVDIMVTITCDGNDNVMTILSGDNDDCTITASADITIKIEENSEEIDEYTITVNNEYANNNPALGFRVYATYEDENAEQVQITTFPTTLPEDTEVTIFFVNNDEDYKYVVTLTINGVVYETKVINKDDSDDYTITLEANVIVNVEKIVNTDGYTITVDNDFASSNPNEGLVIYVTYEEDGSIYEVNNYNEKYPVGSALTIYADNYYDTFLFKVSAIIGGEVVDYVNVDNLGFSYIELDLIGDLTITVEKTGEVEEDYDCDVYIDTLSSVDVIIKTVDDGTSIFSGDTIEENTDVNIEITNNSSKPVNVTIYVADFTEAEKIVMAGDTYTLNGLEIYGDLEIYVSELSDVQISYASDITDVTIVAYDLDKGINEAGVITPSDSVAGGTPIGFVVTNNTEKDIYVYVYNGSFIYEFEHEHFCDIVPAGSTYTYNGTDILAYWDFALYVADTPSTITYDLGDYENVSFELSYTLLSGSKTNITSGDSVPYNAPIDGKIKNNESIDLVIEIYFEGATEPWVSFTLVAGSNAYLSEKVNCPFSAEWNTTFRVVAA
jgi:hypothetical protein